MALDLLLRQGRRADEERPVDIAIASGRIVEIADRIAADAPEERLDGRLVIAGFVESHIHLDKSSILDRCRCEQGTLEEAIASVATAKRSFTEADIYARAQRKLEKAIIHCTTRMRTDVEIQMKVDVEIEAPRDVEDAGDLRQGIGVRIWATADDVGPLLAGSHQQFLGAGIVGEAFLWKGANLQINRPLVIALEPAHGVEAL